MAEKDCTEVGLAEKSEPSAGEKIEKGQIGIERVDFMEIAYRIYPAPNGTIYSDENVKSIDDVIELFDYCQIAEAMISKKGWDYLVKKFSLPELYKANKVSDWFDCEKIEEFIAAIEYEKSIAYNSENEHEAIAIFLESTHFPAP